jgi:hypothetical protein
MKNPIVDTTRTPSRRTILRGAGGFTMALPFLRSLFRHEARAAGVAAPRRFVALATEHGAVWPASMFPPDGALTSSMTYGGHAVRQGTLPLSVAGGVATISPVLSGPSSVLTSRLASKINVVRGLDITWYIAHHQGGHLGNFAQYNHDGAAPSGTLVPMPTIDQVMAWSPSFYGNTSGIRERSLVIGGASLSAGWSSPSTRSGQVQLLNAESNSLTLFNKIFVPSAGPTEVRPPIVDLVREDYLRLRNGNRRLSTEDRRRLDEHVARLDELQRKLSVTGGGGGSACGTIVTPTMSNSQVRGSDFGRNPTSQAQYWRMINDVIVAAFACDTSRIATVRIENDFSTYAGDWHQDVAHKAATTQTAENTLAPASQLFFQGVFLDLISKLDAVQDPGGGGTLLDQTLVQWTQESGPITHDPIDLPVVTAGSAGGFFRTGNLIDYRNMTKVGHKLGQDGSLIQTNVGLVYNQWLGTVLQAMGLARTEYETGDYAGYGCLCLSSSATSWYAGHNKYGTPELSVMGEILPYLKA